MPTPSKPAKVLKMEGKSHRTKKELAQKEKSEKALLSGNLIQERKEVKNNTIAHEEFIRITNLLDSIEKNDAIYEPIINRYCQLQAECLDFEHKIELFSKDLENLESDMDDFPNLGEFYKIKGDMQKQIIALDKQIQTKRKMLLDIEKENIMTIASALRNITKKVEDKTNALKEALSG